MARLLKCALGCLVISTAAAAQGFHYRIQPPGPLRFGTSTTLIVERAQADGGSVTGSAPAASVAVSSDSMSGEFTAAPGDITGTTSATASFAAGAATAPAVYYRDGRLAGGTLSLDAGANAADLLSFSVGVEGFAADMELGALNYAASPAAPFRYAPSYANSTPFLSPDAGHRGTQGMTVNHTAIEAGQGARADGETWLAPLHDDHYTRTWVRVPSGNDQDSVIFISFHTSAFGPPMVEVSFEAGGALVSLGTRDAVPAYSVDVSTTSLGDGAWHLVELEVTGSNTSAGRCRVFVDGALALQKALDWTGVVVTSLSVGLTWIGLAWVGSMDFDDVRMSAAPPASRPALSVSSAVAAGACTPVQISLTDSFVGGAATAPYAMQLSLSSSTPGVGIFQDAACLTPATSATIPATAASATAYFLAANQGPATLSASHQDLLPMSPLSVSVGPGGPAMYDVGCGCAAASGALPLLAFLVAVTRRWTREGRASSCRHRNVTWRRG